MDSVTGGTTSVAVGAMAPLASVKGRIYQDRYLPPPEEDAGAGASVEGAGAGVDDWPGFGMVMGTPAEAQMASRALMTLAWSALSHAFCMQGVMAGVRTSALPQAHLKSVTSQPVCGTPVRKQDSEHWGRSPMPWAATRASRAETVNAYFILEVKGRGDVYNKWWIQ